jgi:predicted NAD/FAD-dependent oxidoreductase
VARVTDNQLKGISAVPAVTIHGSHAFSVEHWDRDRMESGRLLVEAAAPWLGARVTSFQVHGWRFSQPLTTEPSRCVVAGRSPMLVLAGDGFGEGGVQGAALSGMAAAEAVLEARGA